MALTIASSDCATNKNLMHRIDYSGQKLFYCMEISKEQQAKVKGRTEFGSICGTEPRDEFREGEEVELYFYMIATDTNYTFLLDGKPIYPDYQSGKGYIIRFTMPDHDIKLECIHRNTMVIEMQE